LRAVALLHDHAVVDAFKVDIKAPQTMHVTKHLVSVVAKWNPVDGDVPQGQ